MGATGQTIEQIVGYTFGEPQLLARALTHRSWVAEQSGERRAGGDNERFEFLGDALLGFVVSEALLIAHPEMSEGQLSRAKAQLVCASHLYESASKLGLGEFLHLGRGEERNGGRERRTLLANAVEALIAAIYLDGGLAPAKAFILQHVCSSVTSTTEMAALSVSDFKGILQEQAQSRGLPTPRYFVVATSGPEHSKRFTIEARIGTEFISRGEGSSKKAGSQRAAQALMQELNRTDWTPAESRAAAEPTTSTSA